MNNKTLNNIFKGDKVIWMVFFFLCVISVVEVFSASSELTYKGGNYMAPILKHMGLLLMGIVCMVVTLNIKCKYFKIVTPFMIVISLITLLWVFVAGQSTNGAQRWIALLGFQFQPSEIAKGTMILATAQILSAMQTDKGADKHAMGYIIVMWLIMVPLIMVENLSTAALLSLVVLMMMVIGRVPGKQLGKLLGLLTLFGIFVISVVWFTGKDETQNPNNLTEQVDKKQADSKRSKGILHRMDTWKARINKFMNHKELAPNEVDLDKDAQVAHANIAIATANYVGKGPGNSVERDFLSQAFSDFIYAIIIEEMGIEGALFVALLYIILLFRTGRIASRCENNFPAFLAMGLALLLVTQALFNMCVAVGLAPVTGQPLPLVSRGGTSTIINCVYIGVILSISRSAKKKDQPRTQPEEAEPAVAFAK
ncbi:MAG: FtsW/RodA/SpoVE family cell cycle protein [Prevotella sp.]